MRFFSTENLNNYVAVEEYEFHSSSLVVGVSVVAEWFGGWSNYFGTRSATFEKEFEEAKEKLKNKFAEECNYQFPNANGVLNFRIDFEPIGSAKGLMFMLVAQGTVVRLEKKKKLNPQDVYNQLKK